MIVQHNLQAMNANRQLGVNTASQAKSSEKLSSGFRINRAADDAAGLSISEKMRRQVRGLSQASVNAEDGISSVQTAEGALNEVHSMLQRMNELATQASNGTLSTDDRGNIQDEITQLSEEINRVATTTKFNETMLLDGSVGTLKLHVGADGTDDNKISVKLAAMNLESIFGKDFKTGETARTEVQVTNEGGYSQAQLNAAEKLISATGESADGTTPGFTVEIGEISGAELDALKDALKAGIEGATKDRDDALKAAKDTYLQALSDANGDQTSISAAEADYKLAAGDPAGATKALRDGTAQTDYETTVSGLSTAVVAAGGAAGNYTSLADNGLKTKAIEELSSKLQAIDPGSIIDKVEPGKGKDAIDALTTDRRSVNVTDANKAAFAVEAIKVAIKNVSAQRSTLGAAQNRLDHTILNIDNVAENTQAAESRIRDLDMAKEMVEYSKNNILAQAGQSMLAQANQATQGVLSLLR